MNAGEPETRSDAFEAYLARQEARGFRVETRSGFQAVIVRRHPMHFALRWLSEERANERLVVSVDQGGEVVELRAQPTRW